MAVAAAAAMLPTALGAGHTKSTFAVLHFWGDGPLLESRMDPVVDPSKISGHVHTIQGGDAFSFNMSSDFASKATCTTSRIVKDLSNYWAPKLYFQSPDNGTFYDVPLYYMNVYYFFDQTTDEIVPFEPGFRMVSGVSGKRDPPKSAELQLDGSKGEIQPISWTCPQNTDKPAWPTNSNGIKIGMAAKAGGEGVGFPNKNCDGTYSPLRSNIHFPSCYSKAAGLTDYKNNTAWPSDDGKGNMNCPKGYDHVPHLFYELYWNTPLFAGQWKTGGDSQPFVLANGDPTGYGLHADFISGWDKDALKWTIDNCNAGDIGMETCTGIPGGTITGGKQPAKTCKLDNPIAEPIKGALKNLPGCNPVVSSGTAAAVTDCPTPSANMNMGAAGTGSPVAQPTGSTDSGNGNSSPSGGSSPSTSASASSSAGKASEPAQPNKPTAKPSAAKPSNPAGNGPASPANTPPAYGGSSNDDGNVVYLTHTTLIQKTHVVTMPAPGAATPPAYKERRGHQHQHLHRRGHGIN